MQNILSKLHYIKKKMIFPGNENLTISRTKKANNKNIFLYPGITFATVYRQSVHTRVWRS